MALRSRSSQKQAEKKMKTNACPFPRPLSRCESLETVSGSCLIAGSPSFDGICVYSVAPPYSMRDV